MKLQRQRLCQAAAWQPLLRVEQATSKCLHLVARSLDHRSSRGKWTMGCKPALDAFAIILKRPLPSR